MSIHIVQNGESLWSISQRYHISIQSLITVNGLPENSYIIPGLALYIPDNTLLIRSKIINKGDTLWGLAQQYRTTLNAIISANPSIQPKKLTIGKKINIPSPLKLSIATLGFIMPFSPQTSIPILNNIANELTYLAIVSYSLTSEGYAYTAINDTLIVNESKKLKITPLLMIRNFENQQFSPELIGKVLENPVYRKNLISSIMNFVKQKGYGGVSIDFEFIPPPRRQDFNLFLNDLKSALGKLILHVNVHAKTADLPTNRIVGAYDYLAIGRAADIVAVMTIDYGYPTGPPNPVSPVWWIEDVIKYSISLIDHKKLQIALPLYGYDWRVTDNLTKAFSLQYAQNFAISSGATINYNQKAASPNYSYWSGAEPHIVWFDDIRTFAEKYKLIDQYMLLGTTYWQLSLPFPQNWAFLKKNFTIK
ncbi:glycosyl hydrolase family 18 protein [Bacillus sp. S/N-304-OC-R1]|uniref:glycosyl hydrolase family 18 protein n=1 Tax=Bacillus sp. S/N-304-OC-R1 TaxID=2758034 RepID=UPI001C8E661D|nr:glycosyl hydrolase family 18 protein [Bacillus sp. S/N-304-OC-R1]MBY0120412.1 LysM peptidoglycan-binding domain-containing protein [Bacillus sp. S/N-304-OC-R1]